MTVFRVPQCRRCLLKVRTLALSVFALVALAAWGPPSTPCGDFTFTGSPMSGGIKSDVSFSHNAAACGAAACICNTIAYVQIIRVIRANGEFRQPDSEQEYRMVWDNPTDSFDGWAVDRPAGYVWGHYGRVDDVDGSIVFDDAKLEPGTDVDPAKPAILHDKPTYYAVDERFDAVSVPVCIDPGSSCCNKLLGYEHWRFFVKPDGSGSDPLSEIGGECEADVFKLAVKEWNDDADFLNKQRFPTMSRADDASSNDEPCTDEPPLADLAEDRKRYQRALKAMNTGQLIERLTSDSREGLEPFNSSAYREIVARGKESPNAVSPALQLAQKPSADSLLALLALRSLDRARYGEVRQMLRVSVLTQALAQSQTFNTWGIPHLFWEDAAKALIAEGTAAEPPLRALLSDCRDAPVWGSEGALEQRRYEYRLCDYAWALLTEIHGQKPEISPEPKVRDVLIERMRRREPVGSNHPQQ